MFDLSLRTFSTWVNISSRVRLFYINININLENVIKYFYLASYLISIFVCLRITFAIDKS